MSFPGRAVDSAYLHASPPFKTPSGGGLGKPPANYVKWAEEPRGRSYVI